MVNFVWLVIVCIGGFQSGLYYWSKNRDSFETRKREEKNILIFWSKIELFLNAPFLLAKNAYVYALDVQLVVW
jgi:hypothetical protein